MIACEGERWIYLISAWSSHGRSRGQVASPEGLRRRLVKRRPAQRPLCAAGVSNMGGVLGEYAPSTTTAPSTKSRDEPALAEVSFAATISWSSVLCCGASNVQ